MIVLTTRAKCDKFSAIPDAGGRATFGMVRERELHHQHFLAAIYPSIR